MTHEEFKKLRVGDIVRHKLSDRASIVTGHYGDRITAVVTFDVTNPSEWDLIPKQNDG